MNDHAAFIQDSVLPPSFEFEQRARPIIELRGFSVDYPTFVLGPLSLALQRGERVALVGPNGAGKTTTLMAMGGRLRADYTGSVLTEGREMRSVLPHVRTRIGVVPEELAGFRWMTVRQHLDFLRRFYPAWDRDYENTLLLRLGLPETTRLGALSKGMRVKLSIIAAEACRPDVLLLDEPTSGLDPVVRRGLVDIVRDCVPSGGDRTVVFSTHLLEDVEWMADRVIVLKSGTLCMDTTVDSLRSGHRSVSEALYRILEAA